jgi:hypothetical protein
MVDWVEIERLRSLGPEGRSQEAMRLSKEAIRASREALAREHPELDRQELLLLWAEIHYGKELIDRVRADLARRKARG